MKKFNLLKDKHIVELLKKHNLYDYAKKGAKYDSKTVHPKNEAVFPFVQDLLSGVLPKQKIKDVFYGAGKYPTGLTTMYAWAQINQICNLYNDLKTGFPLFEIGFKRCDQNHIQEIIELELETKFRKIGTCLIYHSLYHLYEEPKYGILLSLYTQSEDRWVFADKQTGKQVGVAISSSAYTGLIVPGFDLTHKLALLFFKELSNNEIEFPYNRLGAVSISDLSKENVTPAEAEFNREKSDGYYKEHKKHLPHLLKKDSAFIFETKRVPKVKTILDKWNKQNP